MTLAELCLPGAVLLILLSIAPAKFAGRHEYDNANPRDPGFYRPGFRARSLGAHQNGYESFPFFAAAVLLAEMRGAPQAGVNALAVGFLLVRIVYIACYLGNRPTLRSIAWAVGFACNLAIFFAPLWASQR
jgi:uncharacterized MAPEG superfamily protein